jgi:isoquinoline 1-oxidoreductase alpha subunit
VASQRYKLNVNDRFHLVDVEPETPLLYVLRDDLGLDGPKFGCGLAQCGACTVHLNGEATRSCVYPVDAVGTHKVTTIEGLGANGKMSPLQLALLEAQAPQCGYCIPGITMTASALLRKNPRASDSDIRAALDGNLCRCACHSRVLRAIKLVVAAMA